MSLFPSRTIFLELFGFQVHWYGIMYLLAFLLAWALLPRLQKYRSFYLSREEWSTILSWSIIGVIVGGRLGFVLFYEPGYYLTHPDEILKIWKGGMSSHGGIIGVTFAVLFAMGKRKGDILKVADIAVIPVALGLALGRMGNFINQELYGIATTLPWGITVPNEIGTVHPTQFYAAFKDLLLAAVCFVYLSKSKDQRPGRTLALFLILYSVLRFLVEYLRVQTYPMVDVGILLSRGQVLSIPVLLVGVWLWWRVKEKRSS